MTRDNHRRRRDVRAYMATHDVTYTQALRQLETAETPATNRPTTYQPASRHTVRPVDEGGPTMPAVVTRENDVNPVCGHWLGNQCLGCGTCTTCDGCYCVDLHAEAELDAYYVQVEREHQEHWEKPGEDCPTCEHDAERSKNFTECPKCSKPLQGFWHFREHNPPYCMKDKPHPPGLDWSHLIGKRITIDTHWCYQGDMAKYAAEWTGTVTGRMPRLDNGEPYDLYELELDHSVPQPRTDITTTRFNPREFTITVH